MSESGKQRTVTGRVVSDKMNKTITVRIERIERHPVYGKFVRHTAKLPVHDETNQCKIGDLVAIMQCRPLSKNKAWILSEVLERAIAE